MMNIELMLKNYRTDKSMYEQLELQEKEILFELGCIDEQTTYIGAVKLSDMPKSITNKIVSAVEQIALQREKDQENREQLFFKLAEKYEEKFFYKSRMDKVETLIKALPEEQQLIVENFYIKGLIWRFVGKEYEKKFGEFRAEPTLKDIRNKAIKNLEKLVA